MPFFGGLVLIKVKLNLISVLNFCFIRVEMASPSMEACCRWHIDLRNEAESPQTKRPSDLLTLQMGSRFICMIAFSKYLQKNNICQIIFAASSRWSQIIYSKLPQILIAISFCIQTKMQVLFAWVWQRKWENYNIYHLPPSWTISPVSVVTVKVTNVKIVLLLHCP